MIRRFLAVRPLLSSIALSLLCAGFTAGCAAPEPPEPPSDLLFAVRVNGPVGLIDSLGNVVVEPQFEVAGRMSEGKIAVASEGKWGFLDQQGEWVIEPTFADVDRFSDGRAAFVVGGAKRQEYREGEIVDLTGTGDRPKRGGYIDEGGQVAIEPAFDGVTVFSSGLAAVRMRGLWGYVNRAGEMVIEAQFEQAGAFHDDRAAVIRAEGDAGFVDPDGRWIGGFTETYRFGQGLAPARVEDGTWGFVNPEGEWVLEPGYFWAGHFSEGLAPVRIGRDWAYIDAAGTVVIEPQFEHAHSFSEGRAAVKVRGQGWGFVDATGQLVGEPVWQRVDDFSGGLASVKKNATDWGYVGLDGSVVWEPSS
ncbi:MAG: WG repeat-containing protein [Acidobacteriota bacterium]